MSKFYPDNNGETIMEREIISIQLAIFFKNLTRAPESIGNKIMETFPELHFSPYILHGNIYPLQNFTIDDYINTLSVNPERIDYTLVRSNQEAKFAKDDFIKSANDILKLVYKNMDISRIGLISNLFEKNDNPIELIKERYFLNISDKLAELSFRQNIIDKISNITVNNIYSEESALSIDLFGEKHSGIIIRHDINTIFIENGLNEQEIEDFYNEKINNIFN